MSIKKEVLIASKNSTFSLLLRYDNLLEEAPRFIHKQEPEQNSHIIPTEIFKKLSLIKPGSIITPDYYRYLAKAFKGNENVVFSSDKSISYQDHEPLPIKLIKTGLLVGNQFVGFPDIKAFLARVNNWFCSDTPLSLFRQANKSRLSLLEQADDKILEIQQQIHRQIECIPSLLKYEGFYQNKYLILDAKKFHAAAIAIKHSERLIREWHENKKNQDIEEDGYDCHIDYKKPITQEEVLTFFERHDWKSLFSYSVQSYTSLNKTLMSLSRRTSDEVILMLNRFQLKQPLRHWWQFQIIETLETNWYKITDLLLRASRKELQRAIFLLADYRGWNLRWDYMGVYHLILFVTRYNKPHLGNVVGLVRKAIILEKKLLATKLLELGNNKTKIPPLPLPQDSRVQFLASGQDFANEAIKMNHCIDRYFNDALIGKCYVFHINYEGEPATIMLKPGRGVTDSFAMNNNSNEATEWGTKFLNKWYQSSKNEVIEQFVNSPIDRQKEFLNTIL